jgi:hypothetical protein
MLEAISGDISSRFREVQVLLNAVQSLDDPQLSESRQPLHQDYIRILRGLFFVHLYGAFESSFNLIVGDACAQINLLQIPHCDLSSTLFSMALDPQFRALRDAPDRRKWEMRNALVERFRCQDAVEIPEGVFGIELQNVWCATIQQIFNVFSISEPVVPESRFRNYVDEVVEKRNAIAHGRESPSTVGRRFVTSELLQRYDALYGTAVHISRVFQDFIESRGFIHPKQ